MSDDGGTEGIMYWFGRSGESVSIGAIVSFLGGGLLFRVLCHLLPLWGASAQTTSYCAYTVLFASLLLAIVLQIRHKYYNPS